MKLPIILRIFHSGNLKEVKQFDQDVIVFGHDADVTVDLDDADVSPVHCIIEKRDSGFYICDMGSQTGTLLNGKAVLDERIESGDEITIASYKVVFYQGAPKTKSADEKPTTAPAPAKPKLESKSEPKSEPKVAKPVEKVPEKKPEPKIEKSNEKSSPLVKTSAKKDSFKSAKNQTFAPASQIPDLKKYITPQKGTELEIIVGWQNTILGVHHFPNKANIKAGYLSEECDVYIPVREFGGISTIAQVSSTGAKILIPQTAKVTVLNSDGEVSEDQLQSLGRLNRRQSPAHILLDQAEVLCLEFEADGIVVLFRYTQKTQTVMLTPALDFTSGEMTAMALVTILVGLLGLFVSIYSPKPEEAEKEEEKPIQVAQFIYNKPYTPPEKTQQPKPEDETKTAPPKIKEPEKVKMADKQNEQQNKGNPNNKNQQAQKMATRANEVRPIPGRTSKSKTMTSAYKQGGSVKMSDKKSANAQSANAQQSGLFAALNSGGVREKLDQAYIGVGQALGTADKATGAGGPNENRAGGDVGGRFKDTGAGGKGTATQGIAGIGTQGRGDGTSAYGSANGLGGKDSVTVSGGGFEEEFVGTIDREAVRRVVQEHLREIRSCFERELNKSPGIEGKVVMYWEIGPQGKVLTSSVKTTSLNNANVENCMARAIKSWRFPEPPSNQIGEITYPFNLVGKR